MKAIIALLFLAVVGSASLSPLLVVVAAWLGLDVLLLAGINAYRGRVERQRLRRESQVERVLLWLDLP